MPKEQVVEPRVGAEADARQHFYVLKFSMRRIQGYCRGLAGTTALYPFFFPSRTRLILHLRLSFLSNSRYNAPEFSDLFWHT